jgi:hypothetical protein
VCVARLVDVPGELSAAVLRLRAATRGHQHPGWLPHLTLARRVERADLPRVLEVLDFHAGGGEPLSLVSLRRWDPDDLSVHPIVHG